MQSRAIQLPKDPHWISCHTLSMYIRKYIRPSFQTQNRRNSSAGIRSDRQHPAHLIMRALPLRSTRKLQWTSDRIPQSPIAYDRQPIARIASFQSKSTHFMDRSTMRTPKHNPRPIYQFSKRSALLLDRRRHLHPWSSLPMQEAHWG